MCVGLKLGHTLAKCAEMKVGMSLRTSDAQKRTEAEAFIALHKSEWTNRISSTSLASLKKRKYNCPQILPLTADLVKLKKYQEQKITELTSQLQQEKTYAFWRELLEVVYSRLVIYNKRQNCYYILMNDVHDGRRLPSLKH